MCSVFIATLTKITEFLTVNKHQWLPCILRMCGAAFLLVCDLNVGWVLQPRIVMMLQPLTLQLRRGAISFLSARSMYIVHGTLDVLMTDVPDLVRVAVVAPIS